MSLFLQQEEYLSSLGLSEEDLLKMILQTSTIEERERKQQVLLSERALKKAQDEEYMESLMQDMKMIENEVDDYDYDAGDEDSDGIICKATDADKKKFQEENENEPKEGDLEGLRETRCKFFSRFK